MLRDFIATNRDEILIEARARVLARSAPRATEMELTDGLPVFLDQLGDALKKASSLQPVDHAEIATSAGRHGVELFHRGLTVAQVVHDYGDLCQVITGLAVEKRARIDVGEFRTLNLCLDDAIAGAVTSHARQREASIADRGTERLGFLAHELRNELNVAILSFASIKSGVVAPGGSTSTILDGSLMHLSRLVDSSMAEIRLEVGINNLERIAVWEIIEEVEITAAMLAKSHGLTLSVTSVDHTVIVEVDRQILGAAIANLLQNAFKFTRPRTTVCLRASTTDTRVLIEVEDECGGLPLEMQKNLLKPFVQEGSDRTGLGLGLAICLKAVKAIGGELHIRDLPGEGCIFTIDLPKQPPPPTSILGRQPDRKNVASGKPGGNAKTG
ncbi:MAG: HAMP domain-containing sensor histidine kinase [Polyangiaceae bacterium]